MLSKFLSIRSENRGMAGSCPLVLLVVGLEVQVHEESPIFPLSLPLYFPPLLTCLAPSLPVCPPAFLRQILEVYPGLVRIPEFSLLTRELLLVWGLCPKLLALGVKKLQFISGFCFYSILESRGNFLSPATSQH